jgi:hypothetical protein
VSKSLDNVGVTFVNVLTGRGTLNNVVNLQFGTYQFDSNDDEGKVEPALATSCRLRMDYMCAQQLYESLGQLLKGIAQEQQALAAEVVEASGERPN